MICSGTGWGCFRGGSSLTKGLRGVGRVPPAIAFGWAEQGRNGVHSPAPCHAQFTTYTPPSPPAEQASSHSQMLGESQGDDQGSANTAFTSTISHRLSGPETSAHYISSASAQRPLHLLSWKERKTSHSGPSAKIFFRLGFKCSDLWLIVQFIKVIFPDAVIWPLTHQGCPYSHSRAPSPHDRRFQSHPWALAQGLSAQLPVSRSLTAIHSLALQQPREVGMAGVVWVPCDRGRDYQALGQVLLGTGRSQILFWTRQPGRGWGRPQNKARGRLARISQPCPVALSGDGGQLSGPRNGLGTG